MGSWCWRRRGRRVRTPILILTARDGVGDPGAGPQRWGRRLPDQMRRFARLWPPARAVAATQHPSPTANCASGANRRIPPPTPSAPAASALSCRTAFARTFQFPAQHRGQVVTRTTLLSRVFATTSAGTNLVDVHVAQLQRA